MARTPRKIASSTFALAVLVAAAGVTVLITGIGPAGAFTRGEGAGKAWCAGYGGKNLGSYRNVYACKPDRGNSGKTPFDSFSGFQPTELANRFLFAMTGRTLFDNEVAGNFVALASASYAIPDASSGVAGSLPAAGDIISMWGGRSKQGPNGDRTMVAIVTRVTPASYGWAITTLNQGGNSDTDSADGFNTITVSAGRRTWSTEDGFYRSFDWLRLAAGGHTGLNGWTAAQAPKGSTSQTGQLLSVACSSATNCTAVGTSGRSALLIARGRQRPWFQAAVPVPVASVDSARLVSVACPAASVCVAVGRYSSSGRQQGLLLSGHGTTWTATRAPLPAGAAASPQASVLAVACATSSACVAVGQYAGASSDYALLLTGHGSSWAGRRAPLPADAAGRPAAVLDSIACASASACTAVGSYRDEAGNRQGMLVTGHGNSWTATRSPLPASATVPGAMLSAVTCPLTTECVAVGSFSADAQGFMVSGTGTAWTAAQIPPPSRAAASTTAFRSIACFSASSCVAVGSYTGTSGSSQGLLVIRDGSKLTTVTAPLPPGSAPRQGKPGAQLASVACPSASICVSVGRYTDTAGDAQILLLTGYTSWRPFRAPVPGNATTVGSQAQGALAPPVLAAVACPAVSACVAVGSYPARKFGPEGLLVTGQAGP